MQDAPGLAGDAFDQPNLVEVENHPVHSRRSNAEAFLPAGR